MFHSKWKSSLRKKKYCEGQVVKENEIKRQKQKIQKEMSEMGEKSQIDFLLFMRLGAYCITENLAQ